MTQPTMDPVSMMEWHRTSTTFAPCPACGDTREKKHIISAPNPLKNPPMCDFYQCSGCGSLVPFPFDIASASHEIHAADDAGSSMRFYTDGTTPNYAKFYVEVGGGIDFFIRVLTSVEHDESAKSFLDVGCGFGFTVDYARRVLGWRAVGVEPGYYGRIGAHDLKLDIDHQLLGGGSKFDREQFDVVLNTEVVEHVADPEDFLRLLYSAVKPGGLLLLTTPSAEFVESSAWNEQVLAALSPGFHSILLSELALTNLLRRVGFTDVAVSRAVDRQIVAAGKNRNVGGFDPVTPRLDKCIYYYRTLLEVETTNAIRDGAGFRLFRELVNTGRFDEAKPILARLEASIKESYGKDFFSEANLTSLVTRTHDFENYGNIAPYFIVPFLFYKGMLLLHETEGNSMATACFRHCAAIGETDIDRPLAFFIESAGLLWSARLHLAIALLRENANEEALRVLSEIIAQSAKPPESDRRLLPSQVVTRAIKESGVALLRLGRYDAALAAFSSALQRPEEVGIEGIHEETLGFIWLVEYQQSFASLVEGDREVALARFDGIISRSHSEPVPAYIVSRSIKESGVALLQLGRCEEALHRFTDGMARPEEPENVGIHNELERLLKLAKRRAE